MYMCVCVFPPFYTITLSNQIVSATLSCEMSHDDYRELVVKCWNKFYTCCLQYEKVCTCDTNKSSIGTYWHLSKYLNL